MEKVAVLMSTYNGEKFLREQIESILAQKNVEINLLVRDDGSSDKTLEILKEYSKKGMLSLETGKNCGVGNSFMRLLYKTPDAYDFYAFSDQDDIWLPDKMICAIEKIRDQQAPSLYTGNQMLIDRFGRKMGARYESAPSVDYHQILCNNMLSGCTMVFNRALFSLLRDEKRRPSQRLLKNRIHDVWVAMAAAVSGSVIFDEDSHILYRQHENNVVGAGKKGIGDRIQEIRRKMTDSEQRQGRSRLAREICSSFPEFINGEKRDLKVYGFYTNSISYKRKLLRDRKIRTHSHETIIGFAVKVIFGLF